MRSRYQCARVTASLSRSRSAAGFNDVGRYDPPPPTHTRRLRRNGERGVLVCKVGSADINQRSTSCPVSGGEMPSAPRPCPRAYAALRRRFRFPVLQRRCELLRCSRSSGCLLGTTRRRWQRSSGGAYDEALAAAQHDPTSAQEDDSHGQCHTHSNEARGGNRQPQARAQGSDRERGCRRARCERLGALRGSLRGWCLCVRGGGS